jgi:Helix-turn-helix domain
MVGDVDSTATFAQLQLGFVDQIQWRYEVIRPLVLFGDRTAPRRAQETHTHPETVRQLRRRFRQQGVLGLLPADVEVVSRERASPLPAAVRQEIDGSRRSTRTFTTENSRGSCSASSAIPSMTRR